MQVFNRHVYGLLSVFCKSGLITCFINSKVLAISQSSWCGCGKNEFVVESGSVDGVSLCRDAGLPDTLLNFSSCGQSHGGSLSSNLRKEFRALRLFNLLPRSLRLDQNQSSTAFLAYRMFRAGA